MQIFIFLHQAYVKETQNMFRYCIPNPKTRITNREPYKNTTPLHLQKIYYLNPINVFFTTTLTDIKVLI